MYGNIRKNTKQVIKSKADQKIKYIYARDGHLLVGVVFMILKGCGANRHGHYKVEINNLSIRISS